TFGVWCGAEPLAAFSRETRLEPSGPDGAFERGVGGVDRRCVSFRGAGKDASGRVVAPSYVPRADPPATLDPRPFAVEVAPSPLEAASCETGEVPFGPGCVRV